MQANHEKTKQILSVFEEISRIPRGSKNEAKIAKWLLDWATQHQLQAQKDQVGNVLIRVPASSGYEKSTTVVIQGHMDMVCEKTPDSVHDFLKDPIRFVYEGDWLKADKTTLGADNGIAIAIALVLASDSTIQHPALELLFTVDEETGLTGAVALQPGFISGKVLLNVDSEDEGVFTVGCAGGRDTHIAYAIEYCDASSDFIPYMVKVSGMVGGHSGVNINEERANAIRVLARTLRQLENSGDLRIVDLSGGTAHNAIPRDASAVVFIPESIAKKALEIVSAFEKIIQNEFRVTDPALSITFSPSSIMTNRNALTAISTNRVIDLLLGIPHGVAAMSTEMKGLVETSNNLANIKIDNGSLVVLSSQRSSVMSRLTDISQRIEAVARLAGAKVETNEGYPAWQPNIHSPLLAKCQIVYKNLFGKEPKIEAIHAGLECGIIGDKYPGMDMISFGPTLKNPHSPDEKILVPTIAMIWDFMLELLKNLK